jgi:hypothetical protein
MVFDIMYAYHVTFYRSLDAIEQEGLVPQASGAVGRGGGYAAHSQDRTFLSDCEGVDFWYNRSEDHAFSMADDPIEDGYTPIVLRVEVSEDDLFDDELGAEDSRHEAWFTTEDIEPEDIEVWDGNSWLPIDEWSTIEVGMAYDEEGFMVYQDQNPLAQIECGPADPNRS